LLSKEFLSKPTDLCIGGHKMSGPNEWNKQIIEEFRANGGNVGGHFENVTLLLLHTTGAKSGLPRINPVVTLPDGDHFVIMASKGGRPTSPDWYYNLVANPQVSVEVGSEKFEAQATVRQGSEREQLFTKMSTRYPMFVEYQRNTTRVIPVITLSRR
jgi:deazaflavin-dependent oxidoreductase (nitroreductase family)